MEPLERHQKEIELFIGLLDGRLDDWQREALKVLAEEAAYHQEVLGTDKYKSAVWRTKNVASRLRNSLGISLLEADKLPWKYRVDIRR